MAFCSKCGAQLKDDEKFCSACGTPVEGTQTTEPAADAQTPAVAQTVSQGPAPEYDPADVTANKGMAIISYLGLLVLIPFFAKKDSGYAQFHAKQGMNLLLVWIVEILLGLIKVKKAGYLWGVPYEYYGTPVFVSVIIWILGVFSAVLAIIGIVNAAQGKAKELPILGKLKIFK